MNDVRAQADEDRRDDRTGVARSGDAAGALLGRRQRRAAELLARHARRARARRSPTCAASRPSSDMHVAVLQDLPGPKVRTGPLADGVAVGARSSNGAPFTLTTDAGRRQRPTRVGVVYAGLPHDVEAGKRIYLADGAIALRIESRRRQRRPHARRSRRRAARRCKGSTIPTARSNSTRSPTAISNTSRSGSTHGVDWVARLVRAHAPPTSSACARSSTERGARPDHGEDREARSARATSTRSSPPPTASWSRAAISASRSRSRTCR